MTLNYIWLWSSVLGGCKVYHNVTVKTFVPLKPCCDPAVVKVDKRKKFCLTIQRFICHYNLYVVAGRKKDNMETETTALAKQREATYHSEKERTDIDHEIFPGFLSYFYMLVCWVTSDVRLPLEPTQQKWGRLINFLLLDIFATPVQLYIFTSSRLATNSPKKLSLLSAWGQREEHPLPLALHVRTRS